jgi:hypothetical protein
MNMKSHIFFDTHILVMPFPHPLYILLEKFNSYIYALQNYTQSNVNSWFVLIEKNSLLSWP